MESAMTKRRALCQMSAEAERSVQGQGEALSEAVSDEARRPRDEAEDTGPGLLLAVLARENMQQAWKRVRANKGAAGIDERAKRLLREWSAIREQLLQGTYRPQPVRRVTIPKPDGGQRELGIPTVTDRLIQQALFPCLIPPSASTATGSDRGGVRISPCMRPRRMSSRVGAS